MEDFILEPVYRGINYILTWPECTQSPGGSIMYLFYLIKLLLTLKHFQLLLVNSTHNALPA